MISQELRDQICMNFLGSCSSISLYHEEHYNLDYEEILQVLEEGEIFLCECCGWWCDQSDMNDVHGEYHCTDCCEDQGYE